VAAAAAEGASREAGRVPCCSCWPVVFAAKEAETSPRGSKLYREGASLSHLWVKKVGKFNLILEKLGKWFLFSQINQKRKVIFTN